MTYLSDATPVTYMGAGPAYDHETDDQAMGENTAHSLAGHLINRPTQSVAGTFSVPGEVPADAHPMAASPAAGHGYEDEPTDAAERQAQHVAQTVAKHAQAVAQATGNGLQSGFPALDLDHAQVASNVRTALRGGVAWS